MRAIRAVLLGAAVASALAGCTATGASDAPTWEPSPTGPAVEGSPGARLQPILPVPSLQSGGPSGSPRQSGSPSASSTVPASEQLVVAKHLKAPTGLTILPDDTALVGERTTGRIVRVQPQPNQPVPTVRTLTGLDTSGDGGLLDLAISPTYTEDNLIYAYITTPTDNRVVDFTLTGPVTPVLTGIPKGRTGNTGRLMFDADGSLYVGTGDAGRSSLAANPKSLAGKVLRVDSIGHAVAANPSHTAVFTSGHHVVNGLCSLAGTTTVFEVETGADGRADDVNVLGAGHSYGWPARTAATTAPLTTLPAADRSPGGCAVQPRTLWITSRDGHAVLRAPLSGTLTAPKVGTFTPQLRNVYGRLLTVVPDSAGALWLTTTNRDGHGKPVAEDERVIRWMPSGGGGGTSKA